MCSPRAARSTTTDKTCGALNDVRLGEELSAVRLGVLKVAPHTLAGAAGLPALVRLTLAPLVLLSCTGSHRGQKGLTLQACLHRHVCNMGTQQILRSSRLWSQWHRHSCPGSATTPMTRLRACTGQGRRQIGQGSLHAGAHLLCLSTLSTNTTNPEALHMHACMHGCRHPGQAVQHPAASSHET